jgi:DNA-binding CsgD family transcriptional regulator
MMLKDSYIRRLLKVSSNAFTVEEFTMNLVVGVLRDRSCIGMVIAKLQPNSRLRVVGQFGTTGEFVANSEADAFLEGPLCLTRGNGEKRAPLPGKAFQAVPKDEIRFQSFIVETDGQILGSGALFFQGVRVEDAISQLEVEAIAILSERYLLMESTPDPGDAVTNLTARQDEILKKILEGLTNYQISTSLRVSESTVKHETMKIYKILGVSSRSEAAALVRRQRQSQESVE